VVIDSATGPVFSAAFGMKWSANQIPSHPVRSACWQTSTSSVHGLPAPGQKLKRMYNILPLNVDRNDSSGRWSAVGGQRNRGN
jgi:hypothetical protein